MPTFRYSAFDQEGRAETGEIEAQSLRAALETLSQGRRYVRDVREVEAATVRAGAMKPWWQRDLFAQSLGAHELALFTRELATLVGASVPIDEALRIIEKQPLLTARTRSLARQIETRLIAGVTLSASLASEDTAFPDYYRRMVAAGEATATVAETLDDLASFLEHTAEARERVRSALLYPAVVLLAATVSLGIILAVLVPSVTPVFADAGVQPPRVLAILAAAGELLSHYWPALVFLTAGAVVGLAALQTNERVLAWRDRLTLALPLIGEMIRRRDVARFLRVLALMTRNGVPILQALDISRAVMANRRLRAALVDVSAEVGSGGKLSDSLTRATVIPEVALRLVGIGERSGRLSQMLDRAADVYDAAFKRDMERALSLVSPLVTIVVGLIVGGLVLSVMSAVIGVNELAFR